MPIKQRDSRVRRIIGFGSAILLLGFIFQTWATVPVEPAYVTWGAYGGGVDSMQYSALDSIDKTNVAELELAWFHPAPGPGGRYAVNPIVIDDVMYVIAENYDVVALDARTGTKLWSHPTSAPPTNRGLNYWESTDRSDRRLFFAANEHLEAIDARNGKAIDAFGVGGRVDLRAGLGREPESVRTVQSGTPGRVFENLLILGSATGEEYGSPPGDIRAYNTVTGKLVWTFHTIPRPGEFGYDTWPKDAWKHAGGANAWVAFSIDEERGIAYFPLGSPTYDFYGGDREGKNLFGNTLLALDVRTGERLWHFQVLHHDVWDYDLATSPKLMTVRHEGHDVDIVAQATKFGFLYVFNRATGEPLWPIEERPVPQSDAPGERTWPTQPFPTHPPPFARQAVGPDDLNPYVDEDEAARLRKILRDARNDGLFTPPSATRQTVQVPGELGGSNFGGSAGDPETGMLYVRTMNSIALHKVTPEPPPRSITDGIPQQRGYALYLKHCMACHGVDRETVKSPKTIGMAGFRNVVRTGTGEMPGFPDLEPENVDALAAYILDPAIGETPRHVSPSAPDFPEGQVRYYGQFGSFLKTSDGLPAIAPPWSELVAYDLNKGTIEWRVPLGTVPSLAAKGIKDTGVTGPTKHGIVVTAGGLIFVATGADRTMRAYDKDTGETLWEHEIESNPVGIPAVYEVDGRQYVAFCTASSTRSGKDGEPSPTWKDGKPEAQGYYVFALPSEDSASAE